MATKHRGGKRHRSDRLTRALKPRLAESTNKPPVAAKQKPLADPTCCERCGALYTRRTWRRAGERSHAKLSVAQWTVCPACRQMERGEYFGRVVIRGPFAAAHEQEIRERIANIEERAQFTQPQRRLVSAEREGNVLEVLTTSQKLAHRIVHELKKVYRGRARYSWSPDDGSLYATWER